MRLLLVASGLLALGLAVLGALLPVLPTTPFVLLAAYFFARSSPRLHRWLLAHRVFGPVIENWQQHGAVSPRAKLLCAAMIGIATAYTLTRPQVPLAGKVCVSVLVIGVLVYVLSRPNGPRIRDHRSDGVS